LNKEKAIAIQDFLYPHHPIVNINNIRNTIRMASNMNTYSDKHNAEEKPNPLVKEKIIEYTQKNELPCTIAFNIAHELCVSAIEIGKNADLINFRLTKCQLGLFGYTPEKKIVNHQNTIEPKIKDAIKKALINKRLTCENAWDIATLYNVHKLTISAACESMGIKINKCQLGAF
jgi:hypothetical protein